jgi:MFS family permease
MGRAHPRGPVLHMPLPAAASLDASGRTASRSDTRHILGYVYFTFICYLCIGLPLAVLPPFVHLKMGYSALLAGLVISIQYIATLASRPWAGRISDGKGAKVAVIWGMAASSASGVFLVAAAALFTVHIHWLSVLTLILSRLILGIGESLGSTGATLWGIASCGPASTAKVISYNGICTYGATALGAPLGVIIDQRWGLASLGVFTILIATFTMVLAMRKEPVAPEEGHHLPFSQVLSRVAPHGMGLALGGVCYGVLATFITLYYASRHWNGAALCLTAFGLAFVLARLIFIETINNYGGFPVAMVCLLVESSGALLLWRSNSPWIALTGAGLAGFGFSLVFPAIGVEAVKRVPENNRGTALGVFTAFADVSFFLVGPTAGAIIGWFGYRSVFLFAFLSVLCSLGIVIVLRQMQHD